MVAHYIYIYIYIYIYNDVEKYKIDLDNLILFEEYLMNV